MAAFCSTILNVCGMIKLIGEVTGVFDATLSYSVVSTIKSSIFTSSIMDSSNNDSPKGWIGSTTHGLDCMNCTSVTLVFLFHHSFLGPQHCSLMCEALPSSLLGGFWVERPVKQRMKE